VIPGVRLPGEQRSGPEGLSKRVPGGARLNQHNHIRERYNHSREKSKGFLASLRDRVGLGEFRFPATREEVHYRGYGFTTFTMVC
jgi:hypothetical protein